MNIEREVRILEINKEKLEHRLIEIGAYKEGEYFQKRYTYDFKPKKENKWIRLRTNGKKNTLTIKEVISNTIDGTTELEIEVDDFDKTDKMLEELGYYHRNYQENKRVFYKYGDIEISIDSWPLIPDYVEIEGKNNEDIYKFVEKLNLKDKEITTLDVEKIYREKYKINILDIENLKFD